VPKVSEKNKADDTFSFIFAPEQPLQWKAGQLLRYVLTLQAKSPLQGHWRTRAKISARFLTFRSDFA
jgi:hypothetical protein